MKQITAVVRPSKVDAIKAALVAIDVVGMTINDVRGFGRQKGQVEIYRGNEFTVDFLSKMRITTVVADDKVEAAIAAITEAARTGEIGDGKIFVTPVDDVVRIRTGDRGTAAHSMQSCRSLLSRADFGSRNPGDRPAPRESTRTQM